MIFKLLTYSLRFEQQEIFKFRLSGSSVIRYDFYYTHNVNFQLPGVEPVHIFWLFLFLLDKNILHKYLVVHCGGNDNG
jgi:hypothetical protein